MIVAAIRRVQVSVSCWGVVIVVDPSGKTNLWTYEELCERQQVYLNIIMICVAKLIFELRKGKENPRLVYNEWKFNLLQGHCGVKLKHIHDCKWLKLDWICMCFGHSDRNKRSWRNISYIVKFHQKEFGGR